MRWRMLLAAVVAVLLVLQFVPKGINNPTVDPSWSLLTNREISADVGALLERSCFDCHSHATRWPWYTRVAPVAQVIAHHVREGRQHLNFSTWNQLSDYRRAKLLEEMEEQVKEGHMPLHSYLWLHAEARLDGSDRDRVATWCRQRRAEVEDQLDSAD